MKFESQADKDLYQKYVDMLDRPTRTVQPKKVEPKRVRPKKRLRDRFFIKHPFLQSVILIVLYLFLWGIISNVFDINLNRQGRDIKDGVICLLCANVFLGTFFAFFSIMSRAFANAFEDPDWNRGEMLVIMWIAVMFYIGMPWGAYMAISEAISQFRNAGQF